MKVLILSCNTGQGHNAAGHAVHERFLASGVECEFLDALLFAGQRVSSVVTDAYVTTVTKMPKLFGGMYRAGGLISSRRHKSPIYLMNIAYSNALREYIEDNSIGAVVTPHLFPAEALTHVRKRHSLRARCYSIATDYTCIPFWEETDMDAYFVPHADLLHEYLAKGMPREKLIPTGIPASERFCAEIPLSQARQRLGLPQDKPVFLVMTGSMGFGGAAEIAGALSARLPGALVLVLTGRNEALRQEVAALENPSIRPVGFTDDVPVYMRAADAVLTKPGGLSSTEAAVANVPLVLTAPIPGCETKNAAFFESRGLALTAQSGQAAADMAVSLVKDAALCEKMLACQRNIINPRAAKDCVDFVLRALNEP